MNIDLNMLLTETMEPRLFGLDLQLLFDSGLTLLAVFVLFLVLSYNLFNPARKILEGRSERIKNDLDSAAKDKEEAAKLKEADKEAERILAEARKRGLANEERISEEAKKDAAGIIERAKAEAELEKKKAGDEVKQEMINVASLMAAKVVAKNIDTTIQDELVEDTLKAIGESTWQS